MKLKSEKVSRMPHPATTRATSAPLTMPTLAMPAEAGAAPPTVTRRTRLGHRTAATLLSVAAMTGLATATAPAAAAAELPPSIAWDYTYSGTSPGAGVKVYVEKHGDIISVCDTSANGYSAWVSVMDHTNNIVHYKLTASRGKGSCATHKASEGRPYNLREHSRIALNFEGAGGRGSFNVTFVNNR